MVNPLLSSRSLDPLVECLEQFTRFLGFLLGEIVPLSHVLIQTIKFGLVLIHPVNELPTVFQDSLTRLSSMPGVGVPPCQERSVQGLRIAVNQWDQGARAGTPDRSQNVAIQS